MSTVKLLFWGIFINISSFQLFGTFLASHICLKSGSRASVINFGDVFKISTFILSGPGALPIFISFIHCIFFYWEDLFLFLISHQ
jgi:hypothetical protein